MRPAERSLSKPRGAGIVVVVGLVGAPFSAMSEVLVAAFSFGADVEAARAASAARSSAESESSEMEQWI